jgi:hypothetical protein
VLMLVMFVHAAEAKERRESKYRVLTTVDEKRGLIMVMRACGKRF